MHQSKYLLLLLVGIIFIAPAFAYEFKQFNYDNYATAYDGFNFTTDPSIVYQEFDFPAGAKCTASPTLLNGYAYYNTYNSQWIMNATNLSETPIDFVPLGVGEGGITSNGNQTYFSTNGGGGYFVFQSAKDVLFPPIANDGAEDGTIWAEYIIANTSLGEMAYVGRIDSGGGTFFREDTATFTVQDFLFTSGGIFATALNYNDYIYFGDTNGDFYRCPETDLTSCTYVNLDRGIFGSAIEDGGYIYVASINSSNDNRDVNTTIWKLDPITLATLSYLVIPDRAITASPMIKGDYIYWDVRRCRMDNNNSFWIYKFNKTDMSYVDSIELNDNTCGGDTIHQNPTYAYGYIYTNTANSTLFQIDEPTFTVVATRQIGSGTSSPVAIGNGYVYACDNQLTAYQICAYNISLLPDHNFTCEAPATNCAFNVTYDITYDNTQCFENDATIWIWWIILMLVIIGWTISFVVLRE